MKKIQCKTTLHTDDDGNIGVRPTYGTVEAACADLFLPKSVVIHKVEKVDLLISIDIPIGYKAIIYPRSSTIFKYGVDVITSVIDSDYKGHIHVVIKNCDDSKSVFLTKNTRIAQIELQECFGSQDWVFSGKTREGGFGSTGD